MIVITGDHEGLADSRTGLCRHPAGKDIVSPRQFTLFIVVNSPVGMRYKKVMGQIDMYPTLLNLLRFDDYEWAGLGQSILGPDKKTFALDRELGIICDSLPPSVPDSEFARESWEISDLIIRHDYFKREKEFLCGVASGRH